MDAALLRSLQEPSGRTQREMGRQCFLALMSLVVNLKQGQTGLRCRGVGLDETWGEPSACQGGEILNHVFKRYDETVFRRSMENKGGGVKS